MLDISMIHLLYVFIEFSKFDISVKRWFQV